MIYGCSQLQVATGYVTSTGCGVYGSIVFNGIDQRVPDVGSALTVIIVMIFIPITMKDTVECSVAIRR